MRFDLDALRAEPGRPFKLNGEAEIPDLEWQGEILRLDGPVHVAATAFYQQGEVALRLRVQGRVRRPCSRCLTELMETVEHDDPLEVLPQDVEGRYLELRPFIEAGLRLSLTPKPLCCSDCHGICSECGADLNKQAHRSGCQAGKKEPDPRLSKLRDLLGGTPPQDGSSANRCVG